MPQFPNTLHKQHYQTHRTAWLGGLQETPGRSSSPTQLEFFLFIYVLHGLGWAGLARTEAGWGLMSTCDHQIPSLSQLPKKAGST